MTGVQKLAKIMVLKDMLKEYELLAKYNGGTDYDRWKALEMAIKTLEAEPCSDCVSRQAVLATLNKTSGIRGDALKALYDLPSVSPQQKVGRWIINRDSTSRTYGECSECMMRQYAGTLNYCPHCGAKMEVK